MWLALAAPALLSQETKRINHNRSWTQALRQLGRDGLERLFQEWDADGTATLSKHEFRNGIAQLQLGASPAEVNTLFAKLDTDHSGSLTLDELLNYIVDDAMNNAPPRECCRMPT